MQPPGFTAEFWVNTIDLSNTGHIILDGGYDGGFDVGWQIYTYNSRLYACTAHGGCRAYPLVDGNWHHIALTWTDAVLEEQRYITLYVDGALVDQASLTPTNPNNSFTIGSSTQPFNGLVDEVSIYSRALTLSEIASIHAAGSAGKCDPCGNGFVEPGELCDPASVGGECCNATCDGFTADNTTCNDGDVCTSGDRCMAGSCVHTTLECCGDGVVEAAETCDPTADGGDCCAAGCTAFLADSTPCNDGTVCTTVDVCNAGTCTGGTPLDCDDENDCTQDSCSSGCVHSALPDATLCDDHNYCTHDSCSAGVCTGTVWTVCTDFNPCTQDFCNEVGCVSTETPRPDAQCLTGLGNSLQISNPALSQKDKLTWTLSGGAALAFDELSDPATEGGYAFCVYDHHAGVPDNTHLAYATDPLYWKETSSGIKYNNKVDMKVSVKTGEAGKSSVKVQLKSVPQSEFSVAKFFEQSPSVTVQLVDSHGFCASSTLSEADTTTNTGEKFKAKQ